MTQEIELGRKKQKDDLTLFGQYFENACQQMGLSWEQLANRTGVHQSTISTFTRQGKHLPTRPTLIKITAIFRQYEYWTQRRERILFNLAEWACDEQIAQAQRDALQELE